MTARGTLGASATLQPVSASRHSAHKDDSDTILVDPTAWLEMIEPYVKGGAEPHESNRRGASTGDSAMVTSQRTSAFASALLLTCKQRRQRKLPKWPRHMTTARQCQQASGQAHFATELMT